MVPPTTASVAEPVAVVELVSGVPMGALASVAVKFWTSGPKSSSLQLPTATTAASVHPLNQTCLRMSASLPLEVKEGLHQRRSYAYPPGDTCQAVISNRNHEQRHLLIPSPCGSSPPVPLSLRERGNEGRVERG